VRVAPERVQFAVPAAYKYETPPDPLPPLVVKLRLVPYEPLTEAIASDACEASEKVNVRELLVAES
jgi:hypothetical protein